MSAKNPLNNLAPQQKVFVRAIIDGMSEREACILAYPCCTKKPGTLGFRNPDLRLATLMRTPKVREAIHFMVGHRTSPEIMRNNLALIMADPKLKTSERLKAISILDRLTRGEAEEEKPKKKQKMKPGEMHDDHLQARIKDLNSKVM